MEPVVETRKITWRDFATVKRWKARLAINSVSGTLSQGTEKNIEYWMPTFLKCTEKNPDELIEEAISDPELGEQRLNQLFNYAKNHVSHNVARNGAYGVIRGFYSHNKVNTQHWSAPGLQVSAVRRTDANYPVWIYNEEKDEFELNRQLLRNFLNRLNLRDRTIALCLISTGLDDGDLLKLTVGFVRKQDPRHKRLVLYENRNKTGNEVQVFFSKEATSQLRNYVHEERKEAKDSDPLFVTSSRERKRQFKLKHGREFQNDGLDELPIAEAIDTNVLSKAFRTAQKNMGIKLEKGSQSPFRPKRLRHIFRTASDMAGLNDDRTRAMMGHSMRTSGIYLDNQREIQERFYMKIEPKITILTDPVDEDLKKYQEKIKEVEDTLKLDVEAVKADQRRQEKIMQKREKKLLDKINELENQIKSDRSKPQNS